MYRLIFCFVALLFCSCHTERDHELSLFNGLTFHLKNGERTAPSTQEVQATYETLTDNTVQIPLYRSIESDNYRIFIGLPYRTSLSAMDSKGGDSQSSLTVPAGKDSVYYRRYDRDSLIISEYATRFTGNLIYLAAITSSQTISDSLFDIQSLSERISQE